MNYYRWDSEQPLTPRYGVINGLSRPGFVSVTVFHDHTLDCLMRSAPPMASRQDVRLIEAVPRGPTMDVDVCLIVDRKDLVLYDSKTGDFTRI